MANLELSLLVGKESKEWLAAVTGLVERMEKAAKKLGTASTSTDDEDDTTESTDDDEDFAPKKKASTKAAVSFDDDDDATEETDEDEETVAPKKKAKKITADMVNDACKTRAKFEGGGPEGRAVVVSILKKKFKTKSVSDLKPETYPAVIAAMEDVED